MFKAYLKEFLWRWIAVVVVEKANIAADMLWGLLEKSGWEIILQLSSWCCHAGWARIASPSFCRQDLNLALLLATLASTVTIYPLHPYFLVGSAWWIIYPLLVWLLTLYVNMEDQLARGIESIIYWLGLDIVTRNIVDRRWYQKLN